MTSKERSTFAKFLITFVVAWVPELFFSWIVGKIIDTSLWYGWLGLQAIKLFLWVVRGVVGCLLFHLVWKQGIIDDTYASLFQHKYPNPSKYGTISEADSFFYDVMHDDDLEWETRLDAAHAQGVLASTRTGGLINYMRTNKMCVKAIKKYHEINFSGKDYDFQADPHKID